MDRRTSLTSLPPDILGVIVDLVGVEDLLKVRLDHIFDTRMI